MDFAQLNDAELAAYRSKLEADRDAIREQHRAVVNEHNRRLRAEQLQARYGPVARALIDRLGLDEAIAEVDRAKGSGAIKDRSTVLSVDGVAAVPAGSMTPAMA